MMACVPRMRSASPSAGMRARWGGMVAMLVLVAACRDETLNAPPEVTARSLADSSLSTYNALLPVPPLPPNEALLGGLTSVFDASDQAFELPAANLLPSDAPIHDAGDDGFSEVFVAATGLGPHFNNPSCDGCHAGNGRGFLPAPGAPLISMLLRLSLPGTAPNGGAVPIPGFGDQLQQIGVAPVPAEANVLVSHAFLSGRYADGTPFILRRPSFLLTSPHQPLPPSALVSPRVAPTMVGLGLLEAIPISTIVGLSDEFDRNRDGISGKVNVAFDAINGRPALGRFGLKANNPSMRQQTAGAYNGDIGVTSPVFTHESCEGLYAECAPHGLEISDSTLSVVTFYGQTLGVPVRRNINNPTVRLGQALFTAVGCARCHIPLLQTGVLPGVQSASNQTIRPYTDLLVHDMGPGLADNRPDFRADGREWRTTPLWGVGLTQVVNPGGGYLHDGRARTLPEAILWHGGEAYVA